MGTSYQDYLKSLENEDLSYDAYKKSTQINTDPVSQPNGQTIESEYLDPYVYPALDVAAKSASLIAKPATLIATPLLETARYGVKKLSGQDTSDVDLYSDVKNIQNPKASASELMNDVYNGLGIKQNTVGELTKDWTSRDTDFEKLSSQFPRATSFLKSLRPSDIAAIPVDIAMYGKIAGPPAGKITSSVTNYGANLFDRKTLAKNIIKAGSTDPQLFNELSRTGKIESVANRIINDPSLNRVDREKVLRYLNGSIVERSNKYGVTTYEPSSGKLGSLNKEQDAFIEKIPQNQYDYDAMEANIRAKGIVNEGRALPSVKESALKKIDEMMPYASESESEINLINKRKTISDQLSDVNAAIDNQKLSELSKLTKSQIDAISKKEQIPFFIENPNRVPPSEKIFNTEITGPDNLSNYPRPEKTQTTSTIRQHIPAVGDELVWNREGAKKRLEIVKALEGVQSQIEQLSGSGYENHPSVKNLVTKRNDLASEYWNIADSGFPDEQAYRDHLRSLNYQPIQAANDARMTANNYKSGLVKGTEDYTPGELAANAVEKSAREQIDVGISQMPEEQSSQYYNKQSEISDLLNLNDLYSGTYAKKSDNIRMPVGDMLRGTAREAMALKGTYIDPHLLDIANKYKVGEGAGAQFIKNIGTPFRPESYGQAGMASSMTSKIPTQQEQYMMRRGLVENLADYQVPRNTQQILANKDMVYAKVAQAINDPAMLEGLKDALNKHPDKLKSILPVLVTAQPQLFEADKYNRVDGKVFHVDPMMQEKLRNDAKKDIEAKKDTMTNTERIILLNGLYRDGSLPDSFQ